MSTMGRIIVTALVAAVLVSLTVVGAYYLQRPETEEAALPKPPAMVETPGSTEELGRRTPAAAAPGAAAATPSAVGSAAVASPAGAPGTAQAASPAAAVSAGPGAAAAEEGLMMMRDRPVMAQKRLSEAVRAGLDGPKAQQVREALNGLADRVQLSSQFLPDDAYSKTYQVAPGNALITIGKRFLIPHECVMKLNRMTTPSVAAGQKIKVLQGPIHLEVYKGRKELQAWLGDVCVRSYPVAIGANNKTPEGTFNVKNKLKNPPYQPQHKTVAEHRPGGAADNPLGTRWIDIGNHYGVHGTIDPASIGRDASEGCIRMHNKDVEEVFDLVVVGASKVTIRP